MLESENSNIVRIETGKIVPVAFGVVIITVVQEGNEFYEPAEPVTFTVTVVEESDDMDSDGLDDIWEEANGTNQNVKDASEDDDGDSRTNLAEFIDGTDPQDPNSLFVFQTVGMEKTGDSLFQVVVSSVPGKTYKLMTSSTLQSSHWILISESVANNDTLEMDVEAQDTAYYRVIGPHIE